MDRANSKTPSSLAQPSIRSFFPPKQQPKYAAPPLESTSTPATTQSTPESEDIEPQPVTQAASSQQTEALASEPVPSSRPAEAAPPAPAPTPPPLPPPPPGRKRSTTLPQLPPPPSLHPSATITPVTAALIPPLRRINSLLLQVPYPDSFYTSLLDPSASGLFSRAILFESTVIGSLIIRVEDLSPSSQQLYIQALTILSPYRGLGLATAALEHILSSAQLSSLSPDSGWDIKSVYAHVWTENEEGVNWYTKRGFTFGKEAVKGYYRRLRPDTAWVVRRDLGPMATNGGERNGEGKEVQGSVLAGAVNLNGFEMKATPPPPPSKSPLNGSTQPPPPPPPATRSAPPVRPNAGQPTLSYQKTRPAQEWNDLPPEMVVPATGGGPPKAIAPQHLSAPVSGASSRSSSTARKKKERAYPAAAFGS